MSLISLPDQLREVFHNRASLELSLSRLGCKEDCIELFRRIEQWVNEFANDQPNDVETRKEIVSILNLTLKGFCATHPNIVYQYDVVCDERNNPPSVVSDGKLVYSILMKFSHHIETFAFNRTVGDA